MLRVNPYKIVYNAPRLNIFHVQTHPKNLVFAAVLIDPEDLEIDLQAKQIRSFALNKTHLKLWERQNGKIPHGSFVILRSGWSQFYEFRDKFFGFFADEERQVFPGKMQCHALDFDLCHATCQLHYKNFTPTLGN